MFSLLWMTRQSIVMSLVISEFLEADQMSSCISSHYLWNCSGKGGGEFGILASRQLQSWSNGISVGSSRHTTHEFIITWVLRHLSTPVFASLSRVCLPTCVYARQCCSIHYPATCTHQDVDSRHRETNVQIILARLEIFFRSSPDCFHFGGKSRRWKLWRRGDLQAPWGK